MDENIEELLHTLDVALTSDNPMVKKALKKFLFIVRMTESEASEGIKGPYMSLLEELHQISRRLERLEISQRPGTYQPYQSYPWTTTIGTTITTSGTATSATYPQTWVTNPSTYTSTITCEETTKDAYGYLETLAELLDKDDK